ncbi:unnamed protein product, partial [Trichogramma brassicae]
MRIYHNCYKTCNNNNGSDKESPEPKGASDDQSGNSNKSENTNQQSRDESQSDNTGTGGNENKENSETGSNPEGQPEDENPQNPAPSKDEAASNTPESNQSLTLDGHVKLTSNNNGSDKESPEPKGASDDQSVNSNKSENTNQQSRDESQSDNTGTGGNENKENSETGSNPEGQPEDENPQNPAPSKDEPASNTPESNQSLTLDGHVKLTSNNNGSDKESPEPKGASDDQSVNSNKSENTNQQSRDESQSDNTGTVGNENKRNSETGSNPEGQPEDENPQNPAPSKDEPASNTPESNQSLTLDGHVKLTSNNNGSDKESPEPKGASDDQSVNSNKSENTNQQSRDESQSDNTGTGGNENKENSETGSNPEGQPEDENPQNPAPSKDEAASNTPESNQSLTMNGHVKLTSNNNGSDKESPEPKGASDDQSVNSNKSENTNQQSRDESQSDNTGTGGNENKENSETGSNPEGQPEDENPQNPAPSKDEPASNTPESNQSLTLDGHVKLTSNNNGSDKESPEPKGASDDQSVNSHKSENTNQQSRDESQSVNSSTGGNENKENSETGSNPEGQPEDENPQNPAPSKDEPASNTPESNQSLTLDGHVKLTSNNNGSDKESPEPKGASDDQSVNSNKSENTNQQSRDESQSDNTGTVGNENKENSETGSKPEGQPEDEKTHKTQHLVKMNQHLIRPKSNQSLTLDGHVKLTSNNNGSDKESPEPKGASDDQSVNSNKSENTNQQSRDESQSDNTGTVGNENKENSETGSNPEGQPEDENPQNPAPSKDEPASNTPESNQSLTLDGHVKLTSNNNGSDKESPEPKGASDDQSVNSNKSENTNQQSRDESQSDNTGTGGNENKENSETGSNPEGQPEDENPQNPAPSKDEAASNTPESNQSLTMNGHVKLTSNNNGSDKESPEPKGASDDQSVNSNKSENTNQQSRDESQSDNTGTGGSNPEGQPEDENPQNPAPSKDEPASNTPESNQSLTLDGHVKLTSNNNGSDKESPEPKGASDDQSVNSHKSENTNQQSRDESQSVNSSTGGNQNKNNSETSSSPDGKREEEETPQNPAPSKDEPSSNTPESNQSLSLDGHVKLTSNNNGSDKESPETRGASDDQSGNSNKSENTNQPSRDESQSDNTGTGGNENKENSETRSSTDGKPEEEKNPQNSAPSKDEPPSNRPESNQSLSLDGHVKLTSNNNDSNKESHAVSNETPDQSDSSSTSQKETVRSSYMSQTEVPSTSGNVNNVHSENTSTVDGQKTELAKKDNLTPGQTSAESNPSQSNPSLTVEGKFKLNSRDNNESLFRLYGHQQQQQQQQHCSMSGNSNGAVYIGTVRAGKSALHPSRRSRSQKVARRRKVFYMLKLENEANFGSYTRIRTRILAGAFLSFAGFNSGSSSSSSSNVLLSVAPPLPHCAAAGQRETRIRLLQYPIDDTTTYGESMTSLCREMRGYECGDRQHIHVQRIPLNIECRSDACTRTRSCAPREAIRSPAHACKYTRVRICATFFQIHISVLLLLLLRVCTYARVHASRQPYTFLCINIHNSNTSDPDNVYNDCTEARQVLLYAARSRKKRPTLATREEVSSVGRLRRNKKQQRGSSNAYARAVALNWLVYSQRMRVQEKKPSRRKGIYTTTPHVSYFHEIKSYTKTLRFNDFIRKVASSVGKYNLPLDRAAKSKSLSNTLAQEDARACNGNSSSRAAPSRSSSHSSRCIIYRTHTHTHTQTRDGSEEVPIFEFGTFKFLFVEKKKYICVSVWRTYRFYKRTLRLTSRPSADSLYVTQSCQGQARRRHVHKSLPGRSFPIHGHAKTPRFDSQIFTAVTFAVRRQWSELKANLTIDPAGALQEKGFFKGVHRQVVVVVAREAYTSCIRYRVESGFPCAPKKLLINSYLFSNSISTMCTHYVYRESVLLYGNRLWSLQLLLAYCYYSLEYRTRVTNIYVRIESSVHRRLETHFNPILLLRVAIQGKARARNILVHENFNGASLPGVAPAGASWSSFANHARSERNFGVGECSRDLVARAPTKSARPLHIAPSTHGPRCGDCIRARAKRVTCLSKREKKKCCVFYINAVPTTRFLC